MGKDALDVIKDVTLNVVTGGFYGLGMAIKDTVKTGNPSHLLTQGMDIGMAATGNDLAGDIGGDKARMAFNAAGGAAGAAGGAGAFAGLPGFGGELTGAAALTEGAPAVSTGATELAPGTLSSTSGADMAGAQLGGEVGASAPAAPVAQAAPTGTGVLAQSPSPYASLGNDAAAMEKMGATGLSPEDTTALTSSVERIKQGADVATEASGWSPAVKSALAMGGVLTGGQMITGALGGLFQGVSAAKRLQLEQLINQQNQNQRMYLNKNNAYAPSLKFNQPPKPPTGVLAMQ